MYAHTKTHFLCCINPNTTNSFSNITQWLNIYVFMKKVSDCPAVVYTCLQLFCFLTTPLDLDVSICLKTVLAKPLNFIVSWNNQTLYTIKNHEVRLSFDMSILINVYRSQ